MRPDCTLDVDQETRNILRMYEAVRQKAEDSYLREQSGAADADAGKNKKKGKNDDDAGNDDNGKAKDPNDTLRVLDNHHDGGLQPELKDGQNGVASPGPKTTSGEGPIVNK